MMRYAKYTVLFTAMLLAGCDSDERVADSAAHWQISAEYISNTALKSDADIREGLKYKQLAQLQRDDLPNGVYSHYLKMAKRMQIHPLPALYLDALDERNLPQAMARFTREGGALVVVNQSALVTWSPRQLTAVLGHELVHLKEHHVTAENLAAAFNHPELSVAHELEADRVGSGPLGSCDPQALKEALLIVFNTDSNNLVSSNQIASVDDYDALTGADHPARQERLATLEEMARDLPEGCK